MKRTLLVFFFVIVFISTKAQTVDSLYVTDYGNPVNWNSTGYTINQQVGEYNVCGAAGPAIYLAVFDSSTCLPWTNCSTSYHGQYNVFNDMSGNCTAGTGNCRNRAEGYFIYSCNNAAELQSMKGFIDSIPNGHYILLYSIAPYAYSTCDPAFKNALSDLGFNPLFVIDNHPFIYFCQKGNNIHSIQQFGLSSNDTIYLHTVLTCSSVGIQEISSENKMIIYPNLISSSFTTLLNSPIRDAEVIIYNMLGKEMMRKKFSSNKMEIEKGNLLSGVYFVKVNADERQWVQKIVVE